MSDNWSDFRNSLALTPEEEDIVSLEKAIINAIVEVREKSGLTQNQLSELCGVKQPVISRLENSLHSPQLNSIISILRPLGYRLAVIKDENRRECDAVEILNRPQISCASHIVKESG